MDFMLGAIRDRVAGAADRITRDVMLRKAWRAEMDALLNDICDRATEAGEALSEGRDPFEAADAAAGR